MKKIYISAIAAVILSTGAMAQSNNIKEAFANGKVSGDITLYGESTSKKGNNKNSGYAMGSIGVGYETDSLNGFKGAVAFRANHEFTEKEKGDYSDGTDPEAALSTANISYANDYATIIAGRQEIDLEWMSDFHEAVVGIITAIPDTTLVIGHSTRFMAVDNDGALEKIQHIEDITGVKSNNGASVLDIKYEGIKNTVINPYFMNAKDVFSAYGLKVNTSIAGIDLTAHYAETNENSINGVTNKDGAITHLEIGTTVADISLAAGYITTDKNGAIGSLDTLGDNIDPFEDGGDVYGEDADTYYITAGTEISSIELNAFYGKTNSGISNDKNSEIFMTIGNEVATNLNLELLVSSVNAEDTNDDTKKVALTASYSF